MNPQVLRAARRAKSTLRRARREITRLGKCTDGSPLLEFALVLPLFMTLGLYGTEIANMQSVNMQVSQLALALGDNAARLGQTDNSGVSPTINETDIDSVMKGAVTQGRDINFLSQGRVILSSLEVDPDTDRQYIHWQRCSGNLVRNSSYGQAGYGLTGTTIPGLGKPGRTIAATANSAVMYVEVIYQYRPLFGTMFVGQTEMKQEGAFIIRDDRSLNPVAAPGGITGTGGTSHCG